MQIHSLLEQIIKANPDDESWQGKTEMEWYPPRDFKVYNYKQFLVLILFY
jgi:hypothetical protein